MEAFLKGSLMLRILLTFFAMLFARESRQVLGNPFRK